MDSSRRRFLQSAALGVGTLALGEDHWLRADDVSLGAAGVRPTADTRRIAGLIESTARDDCPAMIASLLKSQVPYREVLAGAFQYALERDGHHTVYLVHSAHQLTLDAAPADRLLPLFWAVDNMKEAIERGGRKPKPVGPLTGTLPKPSQAAAEFDAAMLAMDAEKAEHAIVALSRAIGPKQAYAKAVDYASRDNNFIGHIPISIVSTGRTLDVIGWQHAEAGLRYIVRDVYRFKHTLEGQPYKQNVERVERTFDALAFDWASSTSDPAAVAELVASMKRGKWWNTNDWIAERLADGRLHAGGVWDAVFLFTSELMVRHKVGGRRIGTRALHSNTSANALRHVFNAQRDGKARYLTLLQAVSWVIEAMLVDRNRNDLRDRSLLDYRPVEIAASDADVIDEIFATLPPRVVYTEIDDRSGQDRASELVYSLTQRTADPRGFLAAARRILCFKSTINAHDMKFPIAMFEELTRVSPQWRPHLLAGTVHFMQSAKSVDCPAVTRGIAAMGTS